MSDKRTIADQLDRFGGSIPDAARKHESIVYYMRMDRLVKIGMSRNIFVRVNAIMPQGVMAIEWGARPRERDRHAQFINLHSHGEWYWLREPLWQHIQSLRDAAPVAFGMTVEEWLATQGIRNGQFPAPSEEGYE